MWSMNMLKALTMVITNVTMFCDYKAAINITYNQEISDLSKYIDIIHHLVFENVES
jgi:hypothetical protein